MFPTVNGSFPVASRTETLGIGGDLEKATRFEVIGKKGRLSIRRKSREGGGSKETQVPSECFLEVHK